mmetsp:Transcript_37357/g.117553  ORF Transcript_37357/g.117553 Transcript_37357/m.117553 type:complete len:235 (-) Transcript_37357:706-1410(-)
MQRLDLLHLAPVLLRQPRGRRPVLLRHLLEVRAVGAAHFLHGVGVLAQLLLLRLAHAPEAQHLLAQLIRAGGGGVPRRVGLPLEGLLARRRLGAHPLELPAARGDLLRAAVRLQPRLRGRAAALVRLLPCRVGLIAQPPEVLLVPCVTPQVVPRAVLEAATERGDLLVLGVQVAAHAVRGGLGLGARAVRLVGLGGDLVAEARDESLVLPTAPPACRGGERAAAARRRGPRHHL